jgi:hypothetical protein
LYLKETVSVHAPMGNTNMLRRVFSSIRLYKHISRTWGLLGHSEQNYKPESKYLVQGPRIEHNLFSCETHCIRMFIFSSELLSAMACSCLQSLRQPLGCSPCSAGPKMYSSQSNMYCSEVAQPSGSANNLKEFCCPFLQVQYCQLSSNKKPDGVGLFRFTVHVCHKEFFVISFLLTFFEESLPTSQAISSCKADGSYTEGSDCRVISP